MTKPTALHLVRLVAAAVLAPAVVLNERKVAYPRRLAFQLSVELAAAVLALAVVLNERIVAYPRRLGFQPSGALMLPPLALAMRCTFAASVRGATGWRCGERRRGLPP